MFTLVPAARVAVIILVNRNGGIFGRTEEATLRQLLGARLDESPRDTARAAVPPRARWVGRFASGRDTLRVRARGDSLWYRYGTEAEQRATVAPDGSLLVLGADGQPVQGFSLVRGARTGDDYLHDGLNAFRRVGAIAPR